MNHVRIMIDQRAAKVNGTVSAEKARELALEKVWPPVRNKVQFHSIKGTADGTSLIVRFTF